MSSERQLGSARAKRAGAHPAAWLACTTQKADHITKSWGPRSVYTRAQRTQLVVEALRLQRLSTGNGWMDAPNNAGRGTGGVYKLV